MSAAMIVPAWAVNCVWVVSVKLEAPLRRIRFHVEGHGARGNCAAAHQKKSK